MIIKKVNEIPIQDTPHKVDVRRLYDKDTAQVMHITLKPGEGLKPHITPVDVFFFVLEGKVEVQVGEEKKTVEANSLVESPKDIIHCLANSGDTDSRILVVKAPKPVNKTRVL